MSPGTSVAQTRHTSLFDAAPGSMGSNNQDYIINPESSESIYAPSEYSIDSISRLIPQSQSQYQHPHPGTRPTFPISTPSNPFDHISATTFNNPFSSSPTSPKSPSSPFSRSRFSPSALARRATAPSTQYNHEHEVIPTLSNAKTPPHKRTNSALSLGRLKPLSKLHQAAAAGSVADVLAQLDAGVDINTRDWSNKTALHRAASAGHVDVVRALLDYGMKEGERGHRMVEVDAKASYAQSSLGAHMYGQTMYGNTISDITPLHRACKAGHVEVARLLLDAGSNIEAKSTYRSTPLHFAAENGREEVLAYLLSKGADTEATTGPRARTALRLAAHGMFEGCMRLIVEERQRRGLKPVELPAGEGADSRVYV